MRYAEKWIREFAPDRYKIKVVGELNEDVLRKLSEKQKEALKQLGEFLKIDRKDDEIWDEIRRVAERVGLKPQKVFEAAYLVLLGKPYGPRLIPFIQSLKKDFIVKRFKLEG